MVGLDAKPGESLIGLVARTSGANWLPRLRAILSATTSHWHVHFNLAAQDNVNFAQLAFACRLPPHEIEARRYPPEEIMRTLLGVRFHGATIPAYDLDLRACRFAPSWLRAGYHSALGHHGLATHCPRSGELLIDTCPRCGTNLIWTRSAFYVCYSCGLDITYHRSETVPRRMVQATRLMLDLVNPDPAWHVPARDGLHPLLREIDRGLIFEIGWRMGCALTGAGLNDRSTAKRLAVETRLAILEAGSTALATWPRSLIDALQGIAPGKKVQSLAIASAARQITTFQNARPDLKEAIHRAAPGLKGGPLRAVKASLRSGVNSSELQRTLGAGQKVVERLRGSLLTAAIATGEVNSHQIFEAAALEPLRAMLVDRVGMGTIAQQMNISRHGVEQLACLGAIELFDDGAVRVAYTLRQARRSDYERLLTRLEKTTASIGETEGVPIHHAMRIIGAHEKPWGPTIAAMLSGNVAFSLDEGDRRILDRVRILKRHLAKLVLLRFNTADYPGFAFEKSINRRDTEELLNIFPKSMRNAREEGALPAPMDGAYDRAAILELASKHIAESEVLARWNGKNRRLPAPLRGRGRLDRLNTLGWDRSSVEAAMAGTTLTDRSKPACGSAS
ncbi:MAG TPA: hypothetical protein VF548_01505 [Allosphingosinicella sp.]|jgi:predicted RNA-binding Zn-ribbon protein involved in translation (DUF1610 family)